ncbi:dnaJ homolog subfamily C member 13 [Trichonephila inaurata madagascariensis]|uniref:DnaJ homolog subfamily C member 13 n=1 Tax=Trichonephila inaurata madagascariensis TaxID=2747483 RepID=A0A8X6IMU0_9ARAC|nr:dnaJ homolog subfamily C member 13 [Trichonephila inaurata madagascariensis]
MNPLKDNEDVACFVVTKLSWKGKYKRIFSIGTMGISTYSPNKLEVTNQWLYNDFISIAPTAKGQTTDEFVINMKKGRKNESMRFASELRAEILTEALRFRNKFAESAFVSASYRASKLHWSDNPLPVVLELGPASIVQKDVTSGSEVASYDYKNIEKLVPVSDREGGFVIVCNEFGRQHFFICDKREELMKKAAENAINYIGVSISVTKDTMTTNSFWEKRLGRYSSDEAITSVSDFIVHKESRRYSEPVKRILGLTETCLIERDPQTYSIVTIRPLNSIYALIRHPDNPQKFRVEYVTGQIRSYTSTDRDALLATLLDGVRASGNCDVHVKMQSTCRGQRFGPFYLPVDEEVEVNHLRFLVSLPVRWDFSRAVVQFNNNISYKGLMHASAQESKEKLIQPALMALLEKDGDAEQSSEMLEAQFQCIRRLVASKMGFATFTQIPTFREKLGLKVVKALKHGDSGVTHASVDMLCALMQPMHDEYDLRQEQLNKSSLLSSKKFLESLLEMFIEHIDKGTGALVVSSMLDFLTFALCAPYSETTDGTHFDTLLTMVADYGRHLFRLFQHTSLAIVKGAGLLMKAIIEEGEAEISAKMQELSLAEGALPRHLHIAMFTQSTDTRFLAMQQLSRHLVGLWITGHPTAVGLLKRILPAGLLSYLDSTETAPVKTADYINIRDNLKIAVDQSQTGAKHLPPSLQVLEKHLENVLEHWRERIGLPKKEDKIQQRPIVLRKRRKRVKNEANWSMFYHHFNQDHTKPDLIWNYRTREELKDALEKEMRDFSSCRDLSRSVTISWNHTEFEVHYSSLSEEIKIGDYYLRLLLEEDEKDTSNSSYIKKSYEFFNDLYHRFLLSPKSSMKAMCLQAMAIVYGRHFEEIGCFNDTRFVINMLDRSADKLERDRLVLFIGKLIQDKRNVKEVIDAGGLRILVDLLTLAHLHTSRATVPTQTNVIEASPEMMMMTEKEWYYRNAEKERYGPFGFNEIKDLWTEGVIHPKTRCWAQGMDGWKPVHMIPQLKWTLMATGASLMNESDLANEILRMLIKICEYFPSRDSDGAVIRPLPRAKRMLSDATCLPHIVQLLLTFDPILVEKVAILLTHIMLDNPDISKLYQTGFFYFILMYTGSNLLPIGNLLQISHSCQSFRCEENQASSIMQRSILGQLLPEAMVCYLENHGAEKFAQIFLGEYDTPEAIWSNEMRRLMIEKIASHIAEFTPRLRSNTKALYQYCAIPVVQYPQLENELFCNIYYLRHLCDVQKFPEWPIRNPVKLLKDVLEAWKQEVEKKPPALSVDEAYETLGLKREDQPEESVIRKSYFKLAQKYHPDKNPDGREIFENVNKAYEFLCSKSSRQCEGPDPHNVVLILKAQTILFSRHKEDLHPYKYSGYPMLVKTIKLETNDSQLFSKSAPLLAAASETAYHTVNCSALNAEELRREGGLEALQEAFSRCVGVLSRSSKIEDLSVQVCIHISRCFAVAAQFRGCRERMIEMPDMIRDLCRILYFEHLTKLCTVVVECVSALAVNDALQTHLYQAGVLFHLLIFLFNYDYTLEEGGVQRDEETNKQEISNQLARLSLRALSRLGGYGSGEDETPKNDAVHMSLSALLTPYLANQLGHCDAAEILKILNSNTENPYLIWDNATRAELTEYLKRQRKDKIRSGECDPTFGSDFKFSAHDSELIIGGIFVRVYNEQPTFPLENPKFFTLELLDFLSSQAQYLYSLMTLQSSGVKQETNQTRLKSVEMALEALRNVIKNNPGVEMQCIGHFKLIFSLLRLDDCPKVQALAIDVIAGVTSNQECVNDIAASDVLVYLLLVLHSFKNSTSQTTVLETFLPLMSNGKLVKDANIKGAVIYLLNLFCNATNPTIRELTAGLLGKMTSEKLIGPKLRITLTKFLPVLFLDAMKDSPETAVHIFEGTQENPELIWNDESRESLCSIVEKLANEHYKIQKDDPQAQWKPPNDPCLVLPDNQEIVVAGVYLRLFIQNPNWLLRRPKEFLTELLDKLIAVMSKDNINNELLETLTQALVCLLVAQPSLLDQVPALGHIPRILQIMVRPDDAVAGSCLQIVRQLSNSDICIKYLSQSSFISSMMKSMKRRRDLVGIASEALNLAFQQSSDDLMQQALETKLVPYLLELLEKKLDGNTSAVKAQIVQALKAMCLSLQYGEQISEQLEKSEVWAEYKNQKHDLFLNDTQTSGYLTGGAPSVAGYLTQGSLKVVSNIPPDG